MGSEKQGVGAPHWLVTCSCGWERECSSEWAAQSVTKLHPQLAPMDVAHVTRVEGAGGWHGRAAAQPDLARWSGRSSRAGRANHSGDGGPKVVDAERLLENLCTNFLQERYELVKILMRRHEHNA